MNQVDARFYTWNFIIVLAHIHTCVPRVSHSEGGGFINYSSDTSDSYHVDLRLKESISVSGGSAT